MGLAGMPHLNLDHNTYNPGGTNPGMATIHLPRHVFQGWGGSQHGALENALLKQGGSDYPPFFGSCKIACNGQVY